MRDAITIDELLAPQARLVEEVHLPRRGRTVYVRALYANEGIELSKALQDAGENINEATALQLAAYLCDETGKAVATLEQARALINGKLYAADFRAVVRKGVELNRVDDEGVENAEKN